MIKLKSPKELTKAHRFIKGALKFVDIEAYHTYFIKLIWDAQEENLNFVDTKHFIPEAVINRLIHGGYTVFGEVYEGN